VTTRQAPGDNTTPATKRRAPKPKGTPLKWSDGDQLIQATPTALDLADAAALWRQYSPAWARALFDTAPSND
jgi:hypothetical protein